MGAHGRGRRGLGSRAVNAVTVLTAAERTKLVRMLGMLGSEFEGERAAAALKADKLVRSRGLTWEALLDAPPPRPRSSWSYTQPPPLPRDDTDLAVCGRGFHLLTEWEIDFVTNCSRRAAVSEKQAEVLARVADRLRRAGCR